MKNLVNFILFQIAWFGCVYIGGLQGQTGIAFSIAIFVSIIHLALNQNPNGELKLILTVMLVGSLLETLLLKLGILEFTAPIDTPWGYPLWMSGLWLAFATTLRSSLAWLEGRYLLAGLFGAIGGPLSYYAGGSLGAIVFIDPLPSLILIALFWATVIPLLFYLSKLLK